MSTPTPRTDAEEYPEGEGQSFHVVSADFARQLERDLASAQGDAAALRVEYESRAAWIAKMLSILGCENKDGFNCKDAHATASALMVELAALREDKARLDWLARNRSVSAKERPISVTPESLRAAIDAARKEVQP